jgi:HEAT repeat protein
MRDPRASGPIIEALDDDDPKVVRDAMDALAHLTRRYFPDLRAREPLRKKVTAKDSKVRARAGEALAYLRDELALEYLWPLLLDRVEDVRLRAYRAVGAVVYELSSYMTGKQLTLSTKARQAWQQRMEHALAGPDYQVRELAASILAAIGGEAALPALEHALDTETVEHAREGIGLIIRNTRERLARE